VPLIFARRCGLNVDGRPDPADDLVRHQRHDRALMGLHGVLPE